MADTAPPPEADAGTTSGRRALLAGWLSIVPLLVWWLGWFPGFLSSDSIDQLGQVDRFDFLNFHPISHTFSMWVLTRVWDHPGAITLVHVVALAGLLGYGAKRLADVGTPWWLAAGAAWLTAAIPMVAATTITIWKDVPYSLALFWTFAEMLAMAHDRTAFWSRRAGPIRLGIALGLLWVLRANGFITVAIILLALGIALRDRWRSWLGTAAIAGSIGLLVPAALLATLPSRSNAIEPAEVFMPEVAAVVVHDPDWFSASDRALLTALGPLPVWTHEYRCYDSTPLLFHPAFATASARDDPWAYRSLLTRTALAHVGTVAGHRWCAASYLVWPVRRTGAFLHYPPFEIPPNTLGIARAPVFERAYDLTLAQYQWIEQAGVVWLTWTPALVVLAAIATYGAIAFRPRLRPLLWAGAVGAAQLINVAATTPAQEFRYAFGVYLIGLMSLPLWCLIVTPSRARISARHDPGAQVDADSS